MTKPKRADGATQLDVEKMILDFLVHQGNTSIFEDWQDQEACGEHSSQHLQMVQSFSSLFRSHFPTEKLESKSSFRLKLLQYTLMFSQRTVPGISIECLPYLEALRTGHGRRTSHLSQSKCTSPFGKREISQLPIGAEFRSHYIESLRNQASPDMEPSLMQLQPLFFKLSTYRNALDANASGLRTDWMNLAGQFMFQAAIEQLLVHGTKSPDAITDIFSWAWKEDKNVDEMFADQGPKEKLEWEKVRSCWSALLKPSSKSSTSLAHHLLEAAERYPLHAFEQCMMAFLATIHSNISPPVLSQIEDGQVEGLSSNQSQDLLRRAQVVA